MDGCIARMHAWVGLGGLAVGGWRDGGTDARMNGWKDGWTDGCTDVQMQMCVYIYAGLLSILWLLLLLLLVHYVAVYSVLTLVCIYLYTHKFMMLHDGIS